MNQTETHKVNDNSQELTRTEFWNALNQNSKIKPDIFDCQFTKSYLAAPENYEAIKKSVFEIILGSLPKSEIHSVKTPNDYERIIEQINGTKSLAIKKNWDLFVKLEKSVIDELDRLGLTSLIKGIEFPINVRVAHGRAPEEYKETDYATDHLHSDLWAGEPDDIINCLMYIDGDLKSTYMELYNPLESKVAAIASFNGPYRAFDAKMEGIEKVNYVAQEGQFILFDGVCPHQTIRKGGGARISIDFRIRRVDPYKNTEDKPYRSGMWGKYWYLDSKSETFQQRCENELIKLHESRLEVIPKRTAWITKMNNLSKATAP
ncbi:MAG: hypothetical protein SGI74_09400 [Oligoflexia bacterium]|nr:hypothetical protein [Oligoflexia bacterium]